MMLLTAADAILRYLFSRPITGAFELTEFMMAILVGFGLAYAAVHKDHVKSIFTVTTIVFRSE